MPIERLDHLVLTVRDIAATARFYSDVLGLRVETFGDGRTALHFGQSKINLHQSGQELEPKAAIAIPGSADICLVATEPIEEIAASLDRAGVRLIEGPVERTGALGAMMSVYLRDPDGNLVEISHYD